MAQMLLPGRLHAFRVTNKPPTVHPRSIPTRPRHAALAAVQTAPAELQRELRDRLMQEIEKTPEEKRNGVPLPPVQEILEQLKATAQEQGGFKVEPDLINGRFKGLVNSAVMLQQDGKVSLGQLTFQQFGPREPKVSLDPGTGGLYQGCETPDEYTVRVGFKVAEGEHEGVAGLWSVIGRYSVDPDKPDRQVTHFTNLRMESQDTSPEGLKAWMDFAKSSNPNMDEQGVVTASFGKPIRGHRDFIYLDKDHQVTIGNRGAFVASVRKTE